MNYCTNCGNKLEKGNVYCSECGNKLENVVEENKTMVNEQNGMKAASVVLGILGIVGASLVIFSPISLILSIIGLILGIVATKKGRNVSGIVLNIVGLVLSSIILFAIIIFIRFAIGAYNGDIHIDYDWYDNYYDRF